MHALSTIQSILQMSSEGNAGIAEASAATTEEKVSTPVKDAAAPQGTSRWRFLLTDASSDYDLEFEFEQEIRTI